MGVDLVGVDFVRVDLVGLTPSGNLFKSQKSKKQKHAKFLIWKAKPRLWLCNVTEKRGAGVGHSFCSSIH